MENTYAVFGDDPAVLPENGIYTVVVYAPFAGPYELTLWDAADAPDGVVNTDRPGADQECTFGADGGFECSFSRVGGGSSSGCIYNDDGTSVCWDDGSGSVNIPSPTTAPTGSGAGNLTATSQLGGNSGSVIVGGSTAATTLPAETATTAAGSPGG